MLSLTSDQRRALLITTIIILAAVVIQWVQPYIRVSTSLDYSESDSIFYRLSKQKTYQYTEQNAKNIETVEKTKKKKSQLKFKSINLNTAGKSDLEKLPRIGPKTAQRILIYRNSHGGFKSNQELTEVKGIGPKTYEKIKPYLKDIKTK